jgi:hypothetical protein
MLDCLIEKTTHLITVQGCEWVAAVYPLSLCACVGMSLGDLYLYWENAKDKDYYEVNDIGFISQLLTAGYRRKNCLKSM